MGLKIKLPKLNKKNFPYQLVACYWEDIVGDSSWADIVDIKKAKTAVCCSVGWLIRKDDKVKDICKARIMECGYKPQGFFDKLRSCYKKKGLKRPF